MTALTGLVLLLADNDNDWFDHMDFDGGWWILMMLGMVLFWGLVILGIVWLVREVSGPRGYGGHGSDPVAILDRRLAEGSISPQEYRKRRDALKGAGSVGPGRS